MKKYASPGIDSHPIETGVYNSGAAQSPDYQPYARHGRIADPSSRNPTWDLDTGRMVGNFPATQAAPASSLRIRRRGISPWGGLKGLTTNSAYDGESKDSMLNVGGSVDHNAGASSLIAGGPGAASSMVRMNGVQRSNRGAKLPTLPRMIDRGGDNPLPSGGQRGTIAAPLVPEMLGLPSVIKIGNGPGSSRGGYISGPGTVSQAVINKVRGGLPARYGYVTLYYDSGGHLITVGPPPPLASRWAFAWSFAKDQLHPNGKDGWVLSINTRFFTLVN